MSPLSIRRTLQLFLFAVAYGLLFFLLGKWIVQITIFVGFGLPIFLYLAVDYGFCPVVAAVMGYQSRWSALRALGAGVPLVMVYSFATPVAFAGSPGVFGVPAPWLAALATTEVDLVPLFLSRLSYWLSVFALFFLVGLLQRWRTNRAQVVH